MPRVYKRGTAELDLEEHYLYLAENAGANIADRFLGNAEASFADLAGQPGIGSPMHLRNSELASLRKWRVNDFEKFLIFYLPRPDGVFILRVLHSAQDWWSILGVEE
ncbi:MAG: type II toxin-antitoxin system RelE/ParE family toxin [Nevskia sp.]|nr:type II toxin-antitoxin system RelE/ParE family toxin [Nevskia sp.]